jgi:hypothetical protein
MRCRRLHAIWTRHENLDPRSEAVSEDHTMRDFGIALMDTIKTVFEILVSKKVVSAEVRNWSHRAWEMRIDRV